jgi:hypothetical protein
MCLVLSLVEHECYLFMLPLRPVAAVVLLQQHACMLYLVYPVTQYLLV